MKVRMKNLGFSESIIQESMQYSGLFLGRVIAQYKDFYKIATENSELLAEISGKLRHANDKLSDYPTVGDFVMIDREEVQHGHAIIRQILTRKSVFIRRAAGTSHDVQIVAANIDFVFVCMSLNNDFNLRRLERYLSITWDSGAIPVVVLTKSDLCLDLPEKMAEIEKIAVGVEVIVTSSMTNDGFAALLKYIEPGLTVAFIGSSGVGKSSLINHLLGDHLIKTKAIRKDDKGRHTTSRRDLILIPSGGAVIDTPGMRELGVENANLSKAFTEIEGLAEKCRFKDCQHGQEPGCAVRKAIEEGNLDEARLISYEKLKKEAKYENLNSKQIEKEKAEEMYSSFGGIKNAKAYIKSKNKSK